MTLSDPLIGHQLANFRIERVIGRGGMAQVYFGWDIKLQRPVAIKVIDARYRNKPAYARRFVQEARAVATWRHENIVQIYYADDQDGLYYYVMEYIDGVDLGQLIEQYAADGELMPHEDVLRIIAPVADALDYVHGKGVIHRDVKPSNVIVAGNGRVLLADFGLALDMQEGSQGEIFGSPHYMPPEQARRSSDAVAQSDLYSLGVILYEILTGSLPFDDPSPTTLALQHMTQSLPPPRSRNPLLNEATDAVLRRLLSKEPGERYHSGGDLVAALSDALAAPPPAIVAPAPRPKAPADRATLPTLSTVTVAERVSQRLTERPDPMERSGTRLFVGRRRWQWLTGAVAVILLSSLLGLALLVERAEQGGTSAADGGPSTTPVPLVEVAVVASDTPTPTFTPPPTQTPTVTPSPSPSLTPSPTQTPTATATAVTPSGLFVATPPPSQHLRLLYNRASFYALNLDDAPIDVEWLVFEALDAEADQPAGYSFSGRRWANLFPSLQAGNCNRLTSTGGSLLDPDECNSYNAAIPISPVSTELFWRPRPGIVQFRVFWLGAEVARCDIVAGICNAYLPEES